MLSVEIRTVKDGKDHVAGVLSWDGVEFTQEPESKLLTGILADTLYVPTAKGMREITAKNDPEQFLQSLQFQYKSAYLRAMPAVETEDKEGDDVAKAIIEEQLKGKEA